MHISAYLPLTAILGAVSTTAFPATQPSSSDGTPHGLPPLPTSIGSGIHKFDFNSDGSVNVKRVADLDLTKRSSPTAAESRADGAESSSSSTLSKRVNTWTGCEGYSFTPKQQTEVGAAWDALYNWAVEEGGENGHSPWIHGHYFAMTDSGTFAYLCEWGNGNHVKPEQVKQAREMLEFECPNEGGIYQWNEWKKGVGQAVKGQQWCNGVSYPDRRA